MGLKTKFILVFLLIALVPLILAAGAGYYHISKISKITLKETETSLRNLGEKLVEEKTMDIVKTIQFYLKTQMVKQETGELKWEELQYDPAFLQIAVQTVGKTGYSAVVMKKGGKLIAFLHPNPKLMGADLAPLGEKNPDFWRIIQGPKPGERFSKGYYNWQEPGGQIEKKFMIVMPVPNTPLMVLATIYTKEVEAPLKELETKLLTPQKQFLWQFLLGGAVTVLVVIIVAILFATHMAKPILHLTDVAERISLGELGAPIEITSTDEIGDLADALRRMQVSLRKAVQRLQRRQRGSS
ncbi:MAG: HAMP domain-containing protein [Candidatus Desulfofervidaceae bacterium]|nr:HAMP domain-containing protein [Candidatus Desulfofervidaceae bacterium]